MCCPQRVGRDDSSFYESDFGQNANYLRVLLIVPVLILEMQASTANVSTECLLLVERFLLSASGFPFISGFVSL